MEMEQLSHFHRFLDIYVEWKAILKKHPGFDPARQVATNPIVEDSPDPKAVKPTMDPEKRNVITAMPTFYWAHLQNVRYRLLLSALNHALHLSGSLESTNEPTARGDVITLIFSEMYKIRSLASVLTELPVREGVPPEKYAAGPPFQMPYTLAIPQAENDRWRWHRDMLIASRHLLDRIEVHDTDPRRRSYAAALRESDADLIKLINRIIERLTKTSEVMA